MSDSEENIILTEEPKPKNKVDRRKQTSKLNIIKAREKKFEQLKKKKEEQKKQKEYFMYESADEDTDEEILIKPRKKKETKQQETKQPDNIQIQIDELKNILADLSKSSKKKSRSKTVVNIVNPPKKENKKVEGIKKQMLIKL